MNKMKLMVVAALATLMTTTTSMAGSFDIGATDEIVAVVSQTNFVGNYVGGTISATKTPTDTTAGVFVGHRVAIAPNYRVGAELGLSSAFKGDTAASIEGQLGYTKGKVFGYGLVGGTKTWGTGADNGLAYGVGVDYMINNKWLVGMKATETNWSTTPDSLALGFRAAFKF